MLLSLKASDVDEKIDALRDAINKLNNSKQMPVTAKLAEEQMELLQEAEAARGESPKNIKKRRFVGLSVSETRKLLVDGQQVRAQAAERCSGVLEEVQGAGEALYRVKDPGAGGDAAVGRVAQILDGEEDAAVRVQGVCGRVSGAGREATGRVVHVAHHGRGREV
ncbi:hypothetical protein PINS_up018869 [Pythium insidiosum]|nr:hypothetical protein PINS_up018869 [Pythium insidiosum]